MYNILVACFLVPIVSISAFVVTMQFDRWVGSNAGARLIARIVLGLGAFLVSVAFFGVIAAGDLYENTVVPSSRVPPGVKVEATQQRASVYVELVFRSLTSGRGAKAIDWRNVPCYTTVQVCQTVGDLEAHSPSEIWWPGEEKYLWIAGSMTTVNVILISLVTPRIRRWWQGLT